MHKNQNIAIVIHNYFIFAPKLSLMSLLIFFILFQTSRVQVERNLIPLSDFLKVGLRVLILDS